jgi:hypothetical protein
MANGIYTLANDVVYDQLVALLNSIEIHAGADFPVCVIAYDDRLQRVRAEVSQRKNVSLLENPEIFQRWEEFSQRVWATHPHALTTWKAKGIAGVYRLNCNHRYAAFDLEAPFDRFLYLDADTLLLDSPHIILDQLEHHDFVVYDFQHKDPSHIFNLQSAKLLEIFNSEQIQTQIFCSGCYASKKGMFDAKQRDWIVTQLDQGEAEILYLSAPNQSVLNYMVMRSQIPIFNLALHFPQDKVTGNAVTSTHFEERYHILYDRGKRLTYLHYIGIPSKAFQLLCAGQNVDLPYRDVFLHYRYLHEPESKPNLRGKLRSYQQAIQPSLIQRMLNQFL